CLCCWHGQNSIVGSFRCTLAARATLGAQSLGTSETPALSTASRRRTQTAGESSNLRRHCLCVADWLPVEGAAQVVRQRQFRSLTLKTIVPKGIFPAPVR